MPAIASTPVFAVLIVARLRLAMLTIGKHVTGSFATPGSSRARSPSPRRSCSASARGSAAGRASASYR
jgi:hypothetical protein